MISFKITFAVFAVLCYVQSAYSRRLVRDEPPPHEELAKVARYVIHKADWTSIGTISTQSDIEGYPFVGIKSVSDGPDGDGRGIPYMMMTNMDVSMKDLLADNKCTLFFSLAETDYCKGKDYDAQDPRCARVMLTGSVFEVVKDTDEYVFAKQALIAKHPEMKIWPEDHGFFVAKIEIKQIALIDYFGGVNYVPVDEYFAADINSRSSHFYNYVNVQLLK